MSSVSTSQSVEPERGVVGPSMSWPRVTFDLALRRLLGDGASLSASSVARLEAFCQAEYGEWKGRPMADLQPVYL